MIKTVAIHARIAEETKLLAAVIAARKGMSASAYYKLAIEEANRKYRPRLKIAGPEIVESS